jgi:DNA-binding transcriptional ArsR family regulator
MGLTKTALFTPSQNELADMAKCFAHPARVAILEYLMQQNTCINTSLVQLLGLAQPTISQHLKALKDAHLIKGAIEGKTMNYCINKEQWKKMKENLQHFLDCVDLSNDENCCV